MEIIAAVFGGVLILLLPIFAYVLVRRWAARRLQLQVERQTRIVEASRWAA